MKAQILYAVHDLRYEIAPEPKAAFGEALVAVRAAGICGSDVPRIYQTGAHRMPLIPGHEFSGVVTHTGEGVDEAWVGRRVGVFPLIPCGECPQCMAGHYELCRDYDYIGSRRDGAFAERVAVPARNLIELPDNVSFAAAAMLEPMSVAVHAMRRGLKTADASEDPEHDAAVGNLSAAVCGLGTIGLLLAMFLKTEGIQNLYLIGNKESQRVRAEGVGMLPEQFCNSRETDATTWLRDKTGGGADLVFECVGRQETYQMAIDAAAPMGTVVLVGNPYGDMTLPRDVYWKILRNQLTLTGTWNSSFGFSERKCRMDDWRYVLSRLQNGSIAPEMLITHHLSFDRMKDGLEIMRDKTEDYCKIMLHPDDI